MKNLLNNENFEWLKSAFIAIIAVLVIRLFIFVPIIVDGESMESSLDNGDRMIVTKVGKIQRFDIVVFHANEKEDYIKRVIGLPGDKIEYKDDTLYINGEAYEEPYLDKNKQELRQLFGSGALLTENFTLKSLLGLDRVPKDSLFVLGDNRRNSKDSRYIGVIPTSKVVGTTNVIYWPIKNIHLVD
ncbi:MULTISPECIES: signal peptidase I [Bacillaceae]|uniref:signal peptidase I n=1 Tax=Bacillaceae TaxID=186817 RepID=UPI001E4252EC|nr:signal peptidase I [Bacillus sp. Au-Bac7]MCE4048192.1 signal peptidase I [Bacillus sp. Au-Bac7]